MKHLFETTALTSELWLCPVQYGIVMEGEGDSGGGSEATGATGGEAAATETATETATAGTETEAAKTEAAGTEAEAGKEEKPDKKPWFMDRIDGLTRQKHATEARVQTLEQQNAALRTTLETLLAQGMSPEKAAAAVGEAAALEGSEGGEPARPAPRAPAGPRLYTQAEIDALAANKAREMLAQTSQTSEQEQFNTRCNEVAAEGKTKFADFDSSVATLNSAGVMQPAFLEAVTQLPDAAQILYQLGKSPEEAMRIANLKPIPMAVALARLTAAAPAVRPASNAPAPVTKISGTGSPPAPNLDDETLPIDQWFKLREEGLKARAH